eukprot:SAG11_NODE_2094_length_3834_cov_1.595181_5_plen_122_part_00
MCIALGSGVLKLCYPEGLSESVLQHMVALHGILEQNETALTLVCTAQKLRMYYEGIPFAIRCGGIVACAVAAISTCLFMQRFRLRALRVRCPHTKGVTLSGSAVVSTQPNLSPPLSLRLTL